MTAEAWGVSTDGGQTWNGGMTVDEIPLFGFLMLLELELTGLTQANLRLLTKKAMKYSMLIAILEVSASKLKNFLFPAYQLKRLPQKR